MPASPRLGASRAAHSRRPHVCARVLMALLAAGGSSGASTQSFIYSRPCRHVLAGAFGCRMRGASTSVIANLPQAQVNLPSAAGAFSN
jgi:hypothetical protein